MPRKRPSRRRTPRVCAGRRASAQRAGPAPTATHKEDKHQDHRCIHYIDWEVAQPVPVSTAGVRLRVTVSSGAMCQFSADVDGHGFVPVGT